MADYDTVIIGAGHNGLVCASYLARRNQRVLVLEAREACGGLAATYEFHPGYQASVAHSFSHFSEQVVRELQLARHGFALANTPLACVNLGADGEHVVLEGNALSGVAERDRAAYQDYRQRMERFAKLLRPFWRKTAPPIGNNSLAEKFLFAGLGVKLRLLGKEAMGEFLRVATLPMQDLMDEHFDHPQLKAMLCWDGLIGSRQAPRSPNNSVLPMLYRMSGASKGGHLPAVQGGTHLLDALRLAAESRGVTVRTGAPVERIALQQSHQGPTATGVCLEGGEQISAARVCSSADAKTTFLQLVGVEHLEVEFTNRIRRIRDAGLVAKLHLALDGLPEFTGLQHPDGRLFIAPSMAAIEWAFDDAKYGRCPEAPVMEILIPSLHDPSLAPPGRHVLSAHVLYAPHQARNGWHAQAREALQERLITAIARYAPDIRQQIVARELLTPVDLERKFRVSGGHWHQGDLTLDQMAMMRPTFGAAQHRTPIRNLSLCGASCHPGGDLTGLPGRNAARELAS